MTQHMTETDEIRTARTNARSKAAAETAAKTTAKTTAKTGRQVAAELPVKKLAAFEVPRTMSIYGALGEITLPGDYAEFGVFRGQAARLILAFMTGERKLHLFDSFEGLPEDWKGDRGAGAFKLEQTEIPKFNPKRAVVYKGWFKDTVPGFAKSVQAPLSFVHVDCDLYSSTIDVLFNINELIVPGTILLFDEYAMNRDDGEHQALCEWAEKFGREYQHLWRTEGPQVCTRIIK
jgi:hypothetical protein